ncbi:hypothetical protein [uncultured Alistipes sp.]|uniref:hypothetical protein n=1 Tax=uncultured Alistipes sp. TaxID=538949 RepID=UPI0025EA097E|nr:hypothetical protein [uncultured Alistipes sp.]
MNKKLKLALAALLGFSTACSAVKKTPAEGKDAQTQESDAPVVTDSVDRPQIIVMYGVRGPVRPVVVPEVQTPESDQLDPVAEKPVEDTPAMDTKKGDDTPTGKSAQK